MAKKVNEVKKEEKLFRVTKSYTRKVSLKGISSQYDNITCGTFISTPIQWSDEEDLNKKLEMLTTKVQKETEKDIAVAIGNIMELASDSKNSALVGEGENIEYVKYLSSQIEGFDDIAPVQSALELPTDIEEIEGFGIDIDSEE